MIQNYIRRSFGVGGLVSIIFIFIGLGCSKPVDEYIEELSSDRHIVRFRAAGKLSQRHGDKETVQKLILLLDSNDQRLAFIATQILGSLSDTLAVEPLGRMVDNPHPDIRRRACLSLGSIGHESALPYIVKGLDDPEASVRHAAVIALGYLHYKPALQYIYRMFRDEADSVRAMAIQSLYNYRSMKDAEVYASDLAITLNDEKELVRYVTVQALGGGFSDTTVAGNMLIEALKDEKKNVRFEAINSLKKIRYKRAVPILKEIYKGATVDEEYAITEAIKEITNEDFPSKDTLRE